MNANAPISVLTASYGSRERAVQDFESVWSARHDGDFHHTAVALLSRNSDGTLHVERSSSTAKHLVWGGALLGGALFVLVPATGVQMFATVGLDGAGALIYHFRRNADPRELADTALLLEEGNTGLVVVAVNRPGEALTPLVAHAQRSAWLDLPWGDLEEELCRDFATQHGQLARIAS
jgi:hypothetical protein